MPEPVRPRLTARDFDPEVLKRFDQYVHGQIEAHRYPGTQHGFNNDTTPRFDEAAARLAWQRTLAHLRATLRA